jgi:hypothetical protein
MQGNQEEETESQQARVSHPSEAGRRIKEPGGKQKVNNKESVTPESHLSTYLPTYLSISLSIYLSIYKTEHQQRRAPQETLTQP